MTADLMLTSPHTQTEKLKTFPLQSFKIKFSHFSNKKDQFETCSCQMTGERNRNKNFSEQECYELIRAIQKYVHIIECRESGVRIKNDAKTATWNAICRRFNKNTSSVSMALESQ